MSQLKNRFHSIFWETEHKQNHTVLLLSMVLATVIISMITPRFFTYSNFVGIMEQSALYLIMALGMTFVMITGGIDVSVGSVVGVAVCVSGLGLSAWGLPVGATVLIAVLAGAVAGMFNGLLITKVKLPPIIATIATLNVYRGIAYMLVGDQIYYSFPRPFRNLATFKLLSIPMAVYIALALSVIAFLYLKYHYTGRHSIAIGANPTAARLAGIRSHKVTILIYTLAGLLYGIAGVLTAGKLNSAQAVAGTGIELHIVAVTVIGGTSLMGGYGTILGTVMGTMLIGLLENSLVVMNVSYFWQKFVLGLMIIVAVALRTLRQERQAKSKKAKIAEAAKDVA